MRSVKIMILINNVSVVTHIAHLPCQAWKRNQKSRPSRAAVKSEYKLWGNGEPLQLEMTISCSQNSNLQVLILEHITR